MSLDVGEATVINIFNEILTEEIREKFPNGNSIVSNMSGKDDTTFADYFAHVDAYNVLIEFKQYEKDISREKEKELRRKLCNEIGDLKDLSKNCHYIGWSKIDSDFIEIELDGYLFRVSKVFQVDIEGLISTQLTCYDFIDKFLNKKVGLTLSSFKKYLEFLQSLTSNGIPEDGSTFNAILYSYYNGKIKRKEINKDDVIKLIGLITTKEVDEIVKRNEKEQNNTRIRGPRR